MEKRTATISRKTAETTIVLKLVIDGGGRATVDTGVGFFDHMLVLFAAHGGFDLELQAKGDLWVDQHHTVEDVGICLGQAFCEALGERRGINRYGYQVIPMDEALAAVAVDLSMRSVLVYRIPELGDRVGDFEVQLVPEFLRAFVQHCGATVHVNVFYGDNRHHVIEAIFKALARALRQACRLDPGMKTVPSTKGVL